MFQVPKVELDIVDPLADNSTLGYLYLFLCLDGSTTPDGGMWLIDYEVIDNISDNFIITF